MDQVENPISQRARGNLYILGIIVAAITTPIVVIMQTLQFEQWIPAVTAVTSAVGIIIGSLAKSFLQLPASGKDAELLVVDTSESKARHRAE